MRPDVRLRSGHRLVGGGTLPCAREGRLQAVNVRDLVVGDWVGLSFERDLPGELVHIETPPVSALYRGQKRIQIPEVLTPNLALLLGMYASEGHTSRSRWTVVITNSEEPVLQRCMDLWESCLGLPARLERQRDRCPNVLASSKSLVLLLESLGCGSRASDKRIPQIVMDSPLQVITAFLQGLALDAYTSVSGHFCKWAICLDSPRLLDDLQLLLRRMGIVSGRVGKYNLIYDKTYDEVYVTGIQAQRLLELVPFLEPSKQTSAAWLLSKTFDERTNGADVVPLVRGQLLYDEIPKGAGRYRPVTGGATAWRSLCDPRTEWPSRNMVQRFAAQGFRLPWDVQRVLEEDLHFSQVISTADVPEKGGRRQLAAMGA